MAKFFCISIDGEGKRVQSHHEGESLVEIASFLRGRGLTPLSIEEVKLKASIGQVFQDIFSFFSSRRVRAMQVAVFFRQLATMLEAGVNLSECLESLSDLVENKYFGPIIRQIREYIAWGRRFSEALAEYPEIFSPLAVQMIGVGEEAGSLDRVASDVATYLEKQIEFRKKMITATRYPIFICGFFLVAMGVVVFWLIPQFKDIFASYGAALPPLTQFVINMSDFLLRNVFYEVIIILGLVVLLFAHMRTSKGRARLDRLKLKVPIMAKLIYYELLARITRTLGLLLHSGVLMVVALDRTALVAGNTVGEEAVRKVREGVVQGSTLAEEMKKESFFPSLVVGMVHTGERSGTISEVLPKVADFYDQELDYRIQALTTILEPILIIGLGIGVAFFVLAMYYPIFQLGDVIR